MGLWISRISSKLLVIPWLLITAAVDILFKIISLIYDKNKTKIFAWWMLSWLVSVVGYSPTLC